MQNQQFPESIQPRAQESNDQVYRHHFTTTQMMRYFTKLSFRYVWLILAGLSVGILGIVIAVQIQGSYYDSYSGTYSGNFTGNPFGQFSLFLIILGVVLLVWGIIPPLQHGDQPTDSQYENWVTERSNALYNKAIERLHIDESQCESIIEVKGGISSLLQLTKKFPEKEIVVKRLPNGTRRYSINVSTYIFLTKDDLSIYSGYINAFSHNERFEDADHYYYHDIVGVSTSGPVYTSLDGPSAKEWQRQGFLVRMNNGDVIGTDYATKITLGSRENRAEIQGVDKVVAALLSLLRDHKVTLVEANKTSKDIL